MNFERCMMIRDVCCEVFEKAASLLTCGTHDLQSKHPTWFVWRCHDGEICMMISCVRSVHKSVTVLHSYQHRKCTVQYMYIYVHINCTVSEMGMVLLRLSMYLYSYG